MNHPYNNLSPTQSLVVSTVLRFKQASSSQLRRLHYTGTYRGVRARSSDHLKKLSERGLIRRLPYKLNGYGRGSGEFVYQPPNGTARMPNLHTLDITELYVRLIEAGCTLEFDPEPQAHKEWGGYKITSDAYVKILGPSYDLLYFIEVDGGTEAPNVIAAKMGRYVSAMKGLDGGNFPQVVWLAHSEDRVRDLAREAKKKREPGRKDDEPELFICLPFSEAVKHIIGEEMQ